MGHVSLRTDKKAYTSANKTKLIWTEMEGGLKWNVFFTCGRHTPDVDMYALMLCFFQSKCSNFDRRKASTLSFWGTISVDRRREIKTSAPSMAKQSLGEWCQKVRPGTWINSQEVILRSSPVWLQAQVMVSSLTHALSKYFSKCWIPFCVKRLFFFFFFWKKKVLTYFLSASKKSVNRYSHTSYQQVKILSIKSI